MGLERGVRGKAWGVLVGAGEGAGEGAGGTHRRG